jgi:hypothetical protein
MGFQATHPAAMRIKKASVPHPFDFFLSKGWETAKAGGRLRN